MAKSKARSPRLGRGLSSLLNQQVPIKSEDINNLADFKAENSSSKKEGHAVVEGSLGVDRRSICYLSTKAIVPNPHQPRKIFKESSLKTLADSIATDGLMQPIVVMPSDEEGRFHLVVGERRWRAAQIAGLAEIPALVRDLTEQQSAEWAIVENLQREDLNPIERAEAFSGLIKSFSLSHEQVADRVGIDRSTITNYLRLLNLCDYVKGLVSEGLLSTGQAKVLIGITDAQIQQKLASRIIQQGMSVRQVEQMIRTLQKDVEADESAVMPRNRRDTHLSDLGKQIGRYLGTKVKLKAGRKKGTGAITIEFYSLEQFDALLQQLGVDVDR